MAAWLYTNIQHQPRKVLGISVLEYCVLDYVYKTQVHPEYNINGWANTGCHKIGEFLGVSSGTIKGIFDRMDAIGLLDRTGKDLKRTTDKFYSIAYESDVQKLNTNRSETEHQPVQKLNTNRSETEHNNKVKKTITKDKESITENEFSDSLLSLDEIEELENYIYKTNLTQKRKKVAPKKEKPEIPTLIQGMFKVYEEAFASLNSGQTPIFMKKYCLPLQRLYGILDSRFAEKGLTKSHDLEPWEAFLKTYVDYLKNAGHKEKWLRDNFDPTMILSNFNAIISKLLANKSDHDRNMDKAAEVMNYFKTHETKLDIL